MKAIVRLQCSSRTQQLMRINYKFLRHVRIKLHDGGRFGLSAGMTVFSAFRPGTY
ncbi:hypothetical protein ALQ30_200072 [Pseudomonas syringae pv. persicae]|uniref:Uncharacterized protein n=1 Tax=Pseudomonas syringae pv. persicae TaxID=237306 RepID=A0A3M4AVW4_9PSED|nr:hypothetical protein ALQ30_200072 [Pseudomonas syringae pv. persicae]RMQ13518.1 hypothetical protein ALQ09_101552 [Pseudomonas viridiflava]